MTTKMKPRHKPIYRILFRNQENLYELYARKDHAGQPLCLRRGRGHPVWRAQQMLVDPSEERLKTEFAGVQRTYIPLQAVVRIDEVDKKAPRRSSASVATETSCPSRCRCHRRDESPGRQAGAREAPTPRNTLFLAEQARSKNACISSQDFGSALLRRRTAC